MPKPLVAIVGRPNVGKSTLFNRIVGERLAIVEDLPGTTRDRLYGDAEWGGYEFTLIDTGGLAAGVADELGLRVQAQAELAIDEADVIVFLGDAVEGITAADVDVADVLRRTAKPVILAANKAERPEHRLALADFYQYDGKILSQARTGRWFFAILGNGGLDISDNYMVVKGASGISAIALGQRLVPLHHDGFSTAFMNRVTDRMALGLGKYYIYVVQGKSDIWRLSHFMETELPIKIAINADGGHVVRGRAPVHIVFRWRSKSGTSGTSAQPVNIPDNKARVMGRKPSS